jgi:hypothetical protein
VKKVGIEVTLHLVPGAGHGVGGREVNDRIEAFFDRHPKPAGPENRNPLAASRSREDSGARRDVPAGTPLSQPTGLLFFASYPERDNVAATTNPHIIGALHTIYWSNVEPADGQYDWEEVDRRIGRWTGAGKKVAIRIMRSSSGNWPEPVAKHPTPR